MVRSLIALGALALFALVALSGCQVRSYHPRTGLVYYTGTSVEPPPQEEKIIRVSTAWAYQPEKVQQPPFDKRAAREALASVDVTACGAREHGHVKVTFANDGTVSAAKADWPQQLEPATRACVEATFAKARVVAYDGQPVTLGASWRASR